MGTGEALARASNFADDGSFDSKHYAFAQVHKLSCGIKLECVSSGEGTGIFAPIRHTTPSLFDCCSNTGRKVFDAVFPFAETCIGFA
mmetsp:Transcript_17068/g.20671  ORF Transcript_17068/g.20671 Transcript_17068/m.20671 type:complete len:87 (+) Transcript_17068:132-392(+)